MVDSNLISLKIKQTEQWVQSALNHAKFFSVAKFQFGSRLNNSSGFNLIFLIQTT